MTEAVIENVWVELASGAAAKAERASKPANSKAGAPTNTVVNRMDVGGNANTCRCWRCKGGNVSMAERAAYDRILARYLVRLSEAEREDWLWEWSSVPTHGPDDIRTLTAWMEIERGKQIPHPQYLPRRVG